MDASAYEHSLTLLTFAVRRSLPFFFRFINDSLDVGMCRYLSLIESTSCFRPPETVGRESSMAARAAVRLPYGPSFPYFDAGLGRMGGEG
jgi:hypothetical protein